MFISGKPESQSAQKTGPYPGRLGASTRTCSWTACGDRRSWGGSVENVSVLVAIGVDDTGHREVIGVAEGMKEDKASRGSSYGP